jgi:hypothetical protein
MCTFDAPINKLYPLKTISITAAIILALFVPKVYAQTYHYQTSKGLPDHHLNVKRYSKPSSIDSAYILIDYSAADQVLFGASYMSQQGQLINKYYHFNGPNSDTSNSYKASSMFYQNYDCINSISVAFDSLYATNYGMGFSPASVTSLFLDTIYVPIVQENYSHKKDTLELQLNTVDANGYPTSNTIFDTLIIADTIGMGNNQQIKILKWNLGYYLLSGTKFAVTMIYSDSSKLDSCWFVYGYGYFTSVCPYQKQTTTFADNTHFSKITETKPFIANSFALWNQYKGSGLFPTQTGDNVFFPCDSTDFIFKPGTDGATYLQNINITATAAMLVAVGIPTIHAPVLNISQNYPNPFNNISVINYNLSNSAEVNFKVVDLAGREVLNQNYGTMNPGEHSILLNATVLSPGIYLYSITASGSTVTKKMVIY